MGRGGPGPAESPERPEPVPSDVVRTAMLPAEDRRISGPWGPPGLVRGVGGRPGLLPAEDRRISGPWGRITGRSTATPRHDARPAEPGGAATSASSDSTSIPNLPEDGDAWPGRSASWRPS